MELLGIGALLIFIAWQLMRLRTDVRSLQHPTTVFYSILSDETDANGIEESSIHIRKRISLPGFIAPGMEFAGIADNRPTLIERVVIDSEGRGVHLKPGREPLMALEKTSRWYQSRGWESDA